MWLFARKRSCQHSRIIYALDPWPTFYLPLLYASPLRQATVAKLQQSLDVKDAELAAAHSQLEAAATQAASAQQALQAKARACG